MEPASPGTATCPLGKAQADVSFDSPLAVPLSGNLSLPCGEFSEGSRSHLSDGRTWAAEEYDKEEEDEVLGYFGGSELLGFSEAEGDAATKGAGDEVSRGVRSDVILEEGARGESWEPDGAAVDRSFEKVPEVVWRGEMSALERLRRAEEERESAVQGVLDEAFSWLLWPFEAEEEEGGGEGGEGWSLTEGESLRFSGGDEVWEGGEEEWLRLLRDDDGQTWQEGGSEGGGEVRGGEKGGRGVGGSGRGFQEGGSSACGPLDSRNMSGLPSTVSADEKSTEFRVAGRKNYSGVLRGRKRGAGFSNSVVEKEGDSESRLTSVVLQAEKSKKIDNPAQRMAGNSRQRKRRSTGNPPGRPRKRPAVNKETIMLPAPENKGPAVEEAGPTPMETVPREEEPVFTDFFIPDLPVVDELVDPVQLNGEEGVKRKRGRPVKRRRRAPRIGTVPPSRRKSRKLGRELGPMQKGQAPGQAGLDTCQVEELPPKLTSPAPRPYLPSDAEEFVGGNTSSWPKRRVRSQLIGGVVLKKKPTDSVGGNWNLAT